MERKIYIISLLYILFIVTNCESIIENSETITDIDGNTYQTIAIGNQVWMQENLKTTRYNDDTLIPNVTDDTEWRHYDSPAYSIYNNELDNKEKYGVLYNWQAVGDRSDLCPQGWKVPSDKDWKILEKLLGVSNDEIEDTGIRGINAGGKLKEIGTKKWNDSNISANNKTGFTALPSGRRDSRGNFIGLTASFTAWTSTETSKSSAIYRHLPAGNDGIGRNIEGDKKVGFAVRCIKKVSP
jgi:uncharacterized protein (TIGR02145 family)